MRFRIPEQWIEDFAVKLLREADVDQNVIDDDFENFIYEAGGRGWDEYEDDDGNSFYWVEFDID
jgi:hypothetical protein